MKRNDCAPAVGEGIVSVVLELPLVWEEAPTVARIQVLDARSRENLGVIGRVKTRLFHLSRKLKGMLLS